MGLLIEMLCDEATTEELALWQLALLRKLSGFMKQDYIEETLAAMSVLLDVF